MREVLVDTSIWIEFFRGRDRLLCDRVERLIVEERACCNGVVLGELLYGARGPREADEALGALLAVHVYADTPQVFVEAGHLGSELRGAGVTVPLTDCVIAAQARREDLAVYTADQHLAILAERFGITLEFVSPSRTAG